MGNRNSLGQHHRTRYNRQQRRLYWHIYFHCFSLNLLCAAIPSAPPRYVWLRWAKWVTRDVMRESISPSIFEQQANWDISIHLTFTKKELTTCQQHAQPIQIPKQNAKRFSCYFFLYLAFNSVQFFICCFGTRRKKKPPKLFRRWQFACRRTLLCSLSIIKMRRVALSFTFQIQLSNNINCFLTLMKIFIVSFSGHLLVLSIAPSPPPPLTSLSKRKMSFD